MHNLDLTVKNLTIKNTGNNATTGQFRVQAASGTPIVVNNNLNISGGIMWIAALGYNKSLNVGENVTLTGGELDVVGTGGTYNGTLNITGNLSLSNAAILDLSSGAGTTGTGTVNLKGNYTQSGTSIVRVYQQVLVMELLIFQVPLHKYFLKAVVVSHVVWEIHLPLQ